jgi:hypothetical protein
LLKYAKIEAERRFLLKSIPEDLRGDKNFNPQYRSLFPRDEIKAAAH